MQNDKEPDMRITRIDIEGNEGRYATLTRPKGSDQVTITVLTPDRPNGRQVQIPATGGIDAIWPIARDLQHTLDGYIGTNGDIDGYCHAIEYLAD